MNKFISLLYSLLIGASIVTFIGLGIYAFYPGPDHAKDCYELYQGYGYYDGAEPEENQAKNDQKAFDKCQAERDTENEAHAVNVAIVALIATVAVTATAVYAPITINEIKDGVALGAVMTAVYATIWAGISTNRILLFVSGCLFLASAIVTGYTKFKD
jgi:hypothetical protein